MRDSTLRADYTAAERFMRRRETAGWAALRLLAPPQFAPHALVGAAMGYFTDDVCDRGDEAGRRRRFEAWATRVRAALDTDTATHPLLRAYLHAARVHDLPRTWADAYLEGTRAELDFPEFADEDAYQRYVDALTWPGAMLSTGLTPHLVPDEEFAASVRLFTDGFQRTDLLSDLADDLGAGRMRLPQSDLERYGVTRADLGSGRDTPGVRALLAATATTARAALDAGDRLVGDVPPEYRPLVRSVLALTHHRLDNVCAMGSAITRRPVRDNPAECLRLLARARRADPQPPRNPSRSGPRTPQRAVVEPYGSRPWARSRPGRVTAGGPDAPTR
ncbi:squalene/phytoene synthase family protein [Embleya sp. NPDC050493]|uniref:squalene/phytoene synthase family protein n=1 Tax=Embleya sp. NPDC050493 TaxID=3363989 RepID=UPI00379101A8